ncbi:hypothetical protein [Shewanella sp. TC10]|uniref:hypothetical protein n=1 Tax=Shewanella sp. TC10 TaxID=1419739 RepID=UPI00129E1A3D|nr:hypothetical protein [Shewanella sp. TC10]
MKLFKLPQQNISTEELQTASEAYGLNQSVLLKYQRDFELHVNSERITNCLSAVIEPFKELIPNSSICGFAPLDEDWGRLFPATSPISVNTSTCGTTYILINLNLFPNMTINEQILSLAHENVHLQQVEDGRLKMGVNFLEWEGEDWYKRYVSAQTKNTLENDQTLYRKLPWEVEAYAFEDNLKKQLDKT